MTTKVCFKCNIEKNLSEFYKHKEMSDGHLKKCKICTIDDTRKRINVLKQDKDWVLKEKERNRDKYHRLSYKDKYKKKSNLSNLNYFKKYPEKHNASKSTRRMIREKEGTHLHHWSYNENHYKDVIELDCKDHYLLHRYMIYDGERMMYRNLEGVLLDSKQSHIELLESIIK
jgi:hypothetical protein